MVRVITPLIMAVLTHTYQPHLSTTINQQDTTTQQKKRPIRQQMSVKQNPKPKQQWILEKIRSNKRWRQRKSNWVWKHQFRNWIKIQSTKYDITKLLPHEDSRIYKCTRKNLMWTYWSKFPSSIELNLGQLWQLTASYQNTSQKRE